MLNKRRMQEAEQRQQSYDKCRQRSQMAIATRERNNPIMITQRVQKHCPCGSAIHNCAAAAQCFWMVDVNGLEPLTLRTSSEVVYGGSTGTHINYPPNLSKPGCHCNIILSKTESHFQFLQFDNNCFHSPIFTQLSTEIFRVFLFVRITHPEN